MFPILSRNQIKFIRSLKQKKYRYKFKNYLVEGEKQIADILKYRPEVAEYIVVQDNRAKNAILGDFQIFQVDHSTLQSLSSLVHPQGILAVCRIPDDYFGGEWTDEGFALFMDGVQDPGNLGTILRTAEWYGVNKILIGEGTVDPYSSKVIQAAMGSHSYLPIYECNHVRLSSVSCPIVVADVQGKNAYDFIWPANCILVLGNEGQGISPEVKQYAHDHITLPASQGSRTESLNVSMACTALLTLRDLYIRHN